MTHKATPPRVPARRVARGVPHQKRLAPPIASPTPGSLLQQLKSLGDAAAGEFAQRFFKTGPGEYGEGDRFLGIRVPVLRSLVNDLARDIRDSGIEVALPLLKSAWHEARAVALMLLVRAFVRGDEASRGRIYAFYLKHTRFINNWDLVDLSAPHIVGAWLTDKARERSVLTRLAKSPSLWERRIAIIATLHFIRRGETRDALRIAQLLLKDEEDLIHKAVGWMLREVGKHAGEDVEEEFLRRHYKNMPRTMLRYAIERFAETKRQRYLQRRI
ncbi:MAG TPA: DNA alkylation repair protein [Usitatibacteraceae bacterium]